LLSHADNDEQLQEVKAQVAAINVGWLKWWMAEAFLYTGIPYIKPQVRLQKVSMFSTLPYLCCKGYAENTTWSSDIAHQVKENRNSLGCKTTFMNSCMIADPQVTFASPQYVCDGSAFQHHIWLTHK
jgi:hypothetical protein